MYWGCSVNVALGIDAMEKREGGSWNGPEVIFVVRWFRGIDWVEWRVGMLE